jgi:fido (protein-threonine AMPylation protein)
MHPHDCPGWDYEDHKDHNSILPASSAQLLIQLRSGKIDAQQACCDTRSVHHFLFNKLVPDEHPYFSGNYRGQDFKCLKYYEVYVPSDDTVGIPSAGVSQAMRNIEEVLNKSFPNIDLANELPEEDLSKDMKIVYLVKFATRVLVEFLRVHPYANGNGHMARFIIFAMLARYELWPKKWPLDDSPNYHQHIYDYRRGDIAPLENFILRSVLG